MGQGDHTSSCSDGVQTEALYFSGDWSSLQASDRDGDTDCVHFRECDHDPAVPQIAGSDADDDNPDDDAGTLVAATRLW